jgi:hypothetical protein
MEASSCLLNLQKICDAAFACIISGLYVYRFRVQGSGKLGVRFQVSGVSDLGIQELRD